MSRYNALLSSHFSSCQLLAEARDPHRNRDVKLYKLPGEFAYVGVSDGVESWIAPAVASIFSVNVVRILQDIAAGKKPVAEASMRRRPVTTAGAVPDPPLRRRVASSASPTGRIEVEAQQRKALTGAALDQQLTILRRR